MRQSTTTAIRSYRIYLRDGTNLPSRVHDVDLASDEQARELAARMLDEQNAYPCVEVWDRARLVCTVLKEGQGNRADDHGTSMRDDLSARGAS